MSKPLHCYIFHDDTYELEHVQINEYSQRHWGNDRITYIFYVKNSKGVKTKFWKESTQIDKFIHGRVYTFDLAEKEVRKVVEKTLLDRITSSIQLYLKSFHCLADFEKGDTDMAKKKDKIEVIYTVDLEGREYDGPANFALYDMYKDKDQYIIRYYGCCPIKSFKSIEEAKSYISSNTSHLTKYQ